MVHGSIRFRISSAIVSLGIVCLVTMGCSSDVNYAPPAGSTEIAITHYSFGTITVDDTTYEHDIAISTDSTVNNWRPQVNHSIQLVDIKHLITASTKALIIGIGSHKGCWVADEISEYTDSKKIHLHILDTYEAVKLFNRISKDGLAACFHVNC